jgi:hypothetical protein
MSLTMPQIFMLNHAAWVNAEKNKIETDDNSTSKPKRKGKAKDEGCPDFDNMTSEAIAAYVMNWEM